MRAGVLPGGGRGCLTGLRSSPLTLGLSPGPGPGAPNLGAGGLMRNGEFAENLVLGGGHCSFIKFTFNEVGEMGVCIGVPKMLTVTPYRGKSIC